MKKLKLCKKRLLALMLSAAMIFTSADVSVWASETVRSNSSGDSGNESMTDTVNDNGMEDGADAVEGTESESGVVSDEGRENPGGA